MKAAWLLEKSDTLYVDASDGRCARNGHLLHAMNAILMFPDGEGRSFAGTYCATCSRQYIAREDYARMQDKYGVPLAKVDVFLSSGSLLSDIQGDDEIVHGSDCVEFPDRERQAYLKECGYNVAQKDKLSAPERQAILEKLIVSGELTKEWVCSYLKYMIKRHGQKESNASARDKWQEDLAFVRGLDEKELGLQADEQVPQAWSRDDFLAEETRQLPF